jgi:WD40 repeat protein
VETGKEILILSEHNGRVTALAFSPDGSRIFTASLDGTVKVWHAETGEELLTLRGPQNGFWGFWGLAVSSDGRSIAAASDASSIKIWKTTSPVGD